MSSKNTSPQKRGPGYWGHQRFPESSSPVKQLRLMLKGSVPAVRQKLLRKFQAVRAVVASWFNRFFAMVDHHRRATAAVFLATSFVLVFFAGFKILYTTGTTVSLDGVELATVASEEEAAAARLSVEASLSDVLGYDYTVEDSKVSYSTGITPRSFVVDESMLEDALADSLHLVEHGYALYIDGQFIGATQTEGALEELLEQTTAAYRNENTISIDFVEKVEIRECDLPVEDFTNLADVALLLNSTKSGEVTHAVQAGEVWSIIAQDNNMTNKELLALNPGYDIDKLHVGDVLLISNAVPYLTVIAVQNERYTSDIPYEIEYVDDDTMWVGDTRVISKGVYGTADILAQVTYQGVEEIERKIIEENTLSEPVTEVRARGTKERPSWAPTGNFHWPTHGNITSRFGYRKIFGGTSYHSGIDIANKKGTDITASDGGIVTYAGWMSGYGYLVEIDHQNGYVTRYGHNSEILVSKGDKVFQGQHIAEMGSTGRSTGNHCHFEVRYKGERQDPLNYLP